MQLSTCLLFITTVLLTGQAIAQDKIFKKGGEVVDAKVKSVGSKTVTYYRFDNQAGPEYTILKRDVERIKYQSGSEDVFDEERPSRHQSRDHAMDKDEAKPENSQAEKTKYGPNLLSLAPVQFTENGLGFSLSYERVIDKSGIVAFELPFVATYNLNSGTYYNNATGTYQNGRQDGMYYLMPGVKLYPTGAYGHVRYGIGPSVVIGSGTKSNSVYDNFGNVTYQSETHSLLGIMLNNSLNINPGPHVYLGFEFGLGFSYLNRVGGLNQDTNVLVQGNFKVGWRF